VEGHEGSVSVRALFVNTSGDDFLADTGLPPNEERTWRWCDAAHIVKKPDHIIALKYGVGRWGDRNSEFSVLSFKQQVCFLQLFFPFYLTIHVLTKLIGKNPEESARDFGILPQRGLELSPLPREQKHLRFGDAVQTARGVVNQSELTDARAGAARKQVDAVLLEPKDALHDDKSGLAGFAVPDQIFSGTESLLEHLRGCPSNERFGCGLEQVGRSQECGSVGS